MNIPQERAMKNKEKELDVIHQEVLDIRRRAGLYSEWPPSEPKKVWAYRPKHIVARFKKTREAREFETALGLGWSTRVKYKFVGWLRKILGTDDYDMLQAATPLVPDNTFPTCVVRNSND
jgi:hypothetical protein